MLLFGSSALPEVAVVGGVVPVDQGVALTQLVVITGLPVDLVGRLVEFPDSFLGFSVPSLLRGYKGVGISPVGEGTDFIGFHAFVRFWNSKERLILGFFFFFSTCCHFLNAEVGGGKKRQKDGRGTFSKVVVRKFWLYRNYE